MSKFLGKKKCPGKAANKAKIWHSHGKLRKSENPNIKNHKKYKLVKLKQKKSPNIRTYKHKKLINSEKPELSNSENPEIHKNNNTCTSEKS